MALDQVPDWAQEPGPNVAAAQQPDDSAPDWAREGPVLPAGNNASPAPDESSEGGAFARAAVKGVVPTIGGAAAGIGVGAAAGLAGGPLAPVTVPAGAIAGAFGGGWLAQQGQDWVLDKLGLRDGTGFFSRAQEQADTQQHPYAQFAGNMLDSLLAFGTGGAGKAARLAAGAIMGGTEAGQEAYNEGSIDPLKVAGAAGVGAALGRPRAPFAAIGGTVEGLAARPKGTGTGAIQNPVASEPGTAGRPDLDGTPSQGADKRDLDVANDVTTTAKGVAAENPPAPEIPGAGNPVGAPMQARQAAAPGDPGRNYGKGAPAGSPGVETVPSQSGVSTDPIAADVAAAVTENAAAPAPPINTGLAPVSVQKPGAQPASGLDPVELSRMQREGVANVQQKMAAQQKGEAFQGLPNTQAPPGTVPVRIDPQVVVGLNEPLHVPPHVAWALNHPELQAILKNTPVNRDNHVPYIAGASDNSPITNIDKSIPRTAVLPDGSAFETAPPLILHEQIEKWIMQKLIAGGMDAQGAYRVAHWQFAEPLEDAWYRARGIDPNAAEKWWSDRGPRIQNEPVKNVPEGLYQKPYPDESVYGARHGGNATEKPSADQNAQAKAILAGGTVTAPVTEQAPRAPEAPTPAKTQAFYDERMAQLKDVLAPEHIKRLQALPMEDQLERLRNLERTARGAEGRRPVIEGTGVQARTKAQAETRGKALNAIREAVTSNPGDGTTPVSTSDKQALFARLKNIVQQAEKEPAVATPEKGVKRTWVQSVRVKPPEVQIYLGAKKLLAAKAPSQKAISDFVSLEKQLSGPDAVGAAREIQATKRINADIELARRPTSEEAGEQMGQALERATFETMPIREGKDNSYAEDFNKAAEYLNGLSNSEYDTLASQYDLREEMNEPADPAELMRDMQQTLAATTGKRPGVIERVPAEDTAGVETPIASSADLARITKAPIGESAGAASEGRSRTDLLAEYNAKLKAGTMQTKPEVGGLRAEIKDFFADEGGGGKIPQWAHRIANPRDLFSPRADEPTRDYAESLGRTFKRYRNQIVLLDNRIRDISSAISRQFPEMKKPSFWQPVYRSFEPEGEKVQLTDRQQLLRKMLLPMHQKNIDLYEQFRARRPDLQLPPAQEGYIRHLVKGEQPWEPSAEDQDPVTGFARQSLNADDVSALQDRRFFDLVSPVDNKRYLVSMADDGTLSRWVNGKATPLPKAKLPPQMQPGETVEIGPQKYWIDHAQAREINQHARNEQGKPIQYIENPAQAIVEAHRQFSTALARQKEIDYLLGNVNLNNAQEPIQPGETPLKPSADAMKYMARGNSAMAKANPDWKQSELPQLKGYVMAPAVREIVNDFVKPGFGGDAFQRWERGNTRLTKLMFLSPVFHGLNVLQLWGTARAWDWITPAGYRSLLVNGSKAIKSVAQQDAIQDRILKAGGTLEYPALLNRNTLAQAADMFGLEVKNNMPGWEKLVDPIYQASAKGMWFINDALLTHLFLDGTERMGLSDEAAIQRAHEVFPDYNVQSRIFGSRGMAQLLSDPRLSLFGRYRGGILKTMENVGRGLLQGDAGEKKKAMGYLFGAAATDLLVFHLLLNPLAQWMTGNKDANVGEHGLMTIPGAAWEALTGKAGDLSYTKALNDIWSMAPIPHTIYDLATNRNFLSKPIVQPQDLAAARPGGGNFEQRLKGLGRAGVQAAEYAGRSLVSPMGTAENIGMRKDSAPLSDLRDYLLGIRKPTPAGQRYEAKKPYYDIRDQRVRTKKPQGIGERIYNNLTRMQ